MKKQNESFQMGRSPLEARDELNSGTGHRRGDNTSGMQRHMEEGEDSASSIHKSSQEQLDDMIEDYKNKIRSAVSARLLGKPTKIKMSGNKNLIAKIVELIKMETDYLNAIMTGQGADAPMLLKNKAQIDQKANELDRMLNTTDFWPFK